MRQQRSPTHVCRASYYFIIPLLLALSLLLVFPFSALAEEDSGKSPPTTTVTSSSSEDEKESTSKSSEQEAEDTSKSSEESSTTAKKENIRVRFNAESDSGKSLRNVKIAVYDEDGKKVWTGTTSFRGRVTWSNAPAGEYTYKQTKSINGYYKDTDTHKLTIYEDGTIIGSTTIINYSRYADSDSDKEEDKDSDDKEDDSSSKDKKFDVTITRVDTETKKAIKGAEVSVYTSDDELYYKGETDSNGQLEFKAVAGRYYFKETSPAKGYELNSSKRYFIVTSDGEVIGSTTSSSNKESSIKFNVLGGENKEAVEDVVVSVADEKGTLIERQTSDKEGAVTFKLSEGEYTYTLSEIPDGFVVDEEAHKFSIDEEGELKGISSDIVLTIKQTDDADTDSDNSNNTSSSDTNASSNDSSSENSDSTQTTGSFSFTFSVVSTADGSAIANQPVSISRDGQVISTKNTDENGSVIFDGLASGSYDVYCKSSVDGFYVSGTQETIEIKEDGSISGTQSLKLTPKGMVVLTVLDGKDNSLVSGVGITITNQSGNSVLTEQTDDSGNVYFEVPELGAYSFKASSVPKGYKDSGSSVSFTVSDGFNVSGSLDLILERSGETQTITSTVPNGNGASGSTYVSPDGTSYDVEAVPQTGIEDHTHLYALALALCLTLMLACSHFLYTTSDLSMKRKEE